MAKYGPKTKKYVQWALRKDERGELQSGRTGKKGHADAPKFNREISALGPFCYIRRHDATAR
jgi:hypothetical protein